MGGKSRQRACTRLGKRILVVEDEQAIREMVSSMLASADYHCPAVSSGKEALSLLQSGKRFDLMLCDLRNKPHGIILLALTKETLPEMPVVIMTAPCCEGTADFAANEMGASSVLLTPFDCTELFVTLYRALERSRLPVFHNIGVA